MSSLYKVKNGSWKIDYVKDCVKRTFTVGQVTAMAAKSIQGTLDVLLESIECRIDLVPGTMELVGSLSSRLQKSFERHGLLPELRPRLLFTVRQLCDEWLEGKRLSVKDITVYGYGVALNYLCDFVGADVSVSALSRSDVERFHYHLKFLEYSPTTINKHFRVLRMAFADGVRRERLRSNPFDGYRAGSPVNPESRAYVSLTEFGELLEKIPQVEARAYLAFARYAGLRPSEINHLRFSDFIGDKFRVDWKGKTGERFVPYFKALRPFVDALRTVRDDDNLFDGDGYYSHWVRQVSKSTGVKLWSKFFVNLRASCITDWDGKLSEFVMTSIFGNSQAIRNAHYIQLRGDEVARVLALE